MDCPRCGVVVFADRAHCPSCYWELCRPYSGSSRSGLHVVPRPEAPRIQTADDAFLLSPPPPAPQRRAPRSARSRRRRRSGSSGAAERNWQLLRSDGGVATLAEPARLSGQARWERRRPNVVGMPLVQTSFDFAAAELEAEHWAGHAAAPLWRRCQAGLLDAALILLASGVFFGLFVLLAPTGSGLEGHLGWGRRDLLVYLLAGFVLATLYFGLFTLLGGRTPGMQYHGLQAVSLEGQPLSLSRALWRAFGYMVSTGALLMGFLWALVDDRHLTWHDHISKTFITNHTEV
ncbi:MAG: RDD family protein [Terriglobia bacterium]